MHKNAITAGLLPAEGGQVELAQLENSEKAIRRLIGRLGGPEGSRSVTRPARAATTLIGCCVDGRGVRHRRAVADPGTAGRWVKTDRRDARKLARLYRAGELSFVRPPTPEQEGLRDLVRCRDDLRRARTAARHRVGKQLLRYGRIYREGKKAWTLQHRAWVRRQRLDDPLAQAALEHMLCHLDALDAQLAAVDRQLEQVAASHPWCDPVAGSPASAASRR